MTEEQVTAALGEPNSREAKSDTALLDFTSPKTKGRHIAVGIRDSKVHVVYIYRRLFESFNIGSLIAKADQFKWESGVFEDSTQAFLIAKRNLFSNF
jgi:hypothetical protein